MIEAAFPQRISDDTTGQRLLSEAEMAALLEAALPADRSGHDLWVFGYGSLMWRPEPEMIEPRIALLRGWHRRFCLWQWRGRGTRAQPGLMLALDRGGSCRGVAYRIPGPDIRVGLAGLWRREMRGNGYRPRHVRLVTADGPLDALTFVAHRHGERYAGALADAAIARYIAGACGHVGPSAEYLLETVTRCEALGIPDRSLWRLQMMVADHLERNSRCP